VILAAGVGSRLGQPFPKSLTPVGIDGETILGRQIRTLGDAFHPHDISVVVGFKKDLIMEGFPEVSYIYNRNYAETNTSKSLLQALRFYKNQDVLWLNGDVVFDEAVTASLVDAVANGRSFVGITREQVGDEEVKYRLSRSGLIAEISKTVSAPEGEAIGINYINQADKPFLIDQLSICSPDDYFERGLEKAIEANEVKIEPLDLTGLDCIEVDFIEDLDKARSMLAQPHSPAR
jgi:choline kinase